jgi:hypothetical protein
MDLFSSLDIRGGSRTANRPYDTPFGTQILSP